MKYLHPASKEPRRKINSEKKDVPLSDYKKSSLLPATQHRITEKILQSQIIANRKEKCFRVSSTVIMIPLSVSQSSLPSVPLQTADIQDQRKSPLTAFRGFPHSALQADYSRNTSFPATPQNPEPSHMAFEQKMLPAELLRSP